MHEKKTIGILLSIILYIFQTLKKKISKDFDPWFEILSIIQGKIYIGLIVLTIYSRKEND